MSVPIDSFEDPLAGIVQFDDSGRRRTVQLEVDQDEYLLAIVVCITSGESDRRLPVGACGDQILHR